MELVTRRLSPHHKPLSSLAGCRASDLAGWCNPGKDVVLDTNHSNCRESKSISKALNKLDTQILEVIRHDTNPHPLLARQSNQQNYRWLGAALKTAMLGAQGKIKLSPATDSDEAYYYAGNQVRANSFHPIRSAKLSPQSLKRA